MAALTKDGNPCPHFAARALCPRIRRPDVARQGAHCVLLSGLSLSSRRAVQQHSLASRKHKDWRIAQCDRRGRGGEVRTARPGKGKGQWASAGSTRRAFTQRDHYRTLNLLPALLSKQDGVVAHSSIATTKNTLPPFTPLAPSSYPLGPLPPFSSPPQTIRNSLNKPLAPASAPAALHPSLYLRLPRPPAS